jgi:hypothetical protein
VLPHAASPWLPLRPDDVEQGFRSHAERLRQLTEQSAGRHALRWSLRVLRGSLAEAPRLLGGESALLFLASAPAPDPSAGHRAPAARRPPVIALAADEGGPAAPASAAAVQLARALGGVVQPWPPTAAGTRPDVLVMPRRSIVPGALARPPCPLLLLVA